MKNFYKILDNKHNIDYTNEEKILEIIKDTVLQSITLNTLFKINCCFYREKEAKQYFLLDFSYKNIEDNFTISLEELLLKKQSGISVELIYKNALSMKYIDNHQQQLIFSSILKKIEEYYLFVLKENRFCLNNNKKTTHSQDFRTALKHTFRLTNNIKLNILTKIFYSHFDFEKKNFSTYDLNSFHKLSDSDYTFDIDFSLKPSFSKNIIDENNIVEQIIKKIEKENLSLKNKTSIQIFTKKLIYMTDNLNFNKSKYNFLFKNLLNFSKSEKNIFNFYIYNLDFISLFFSFAQQHKLSYNKETLQEIDFYSMKYKRLPYKDFYYILLNHFLKKHYKYKKFKIDKEVLSPLYMIFYEIDEITFLEDEEVFLIHQIVSFSFFLDDGVLMGKSFQYISKFISNLVNEIKILKLKQINIYKSLLNNPFMFFFNNFHIILDICENSKVHSLIFNEEKFLLDYQKQTSSNIISDYLNLNSICDFYSKDNIVYHKLHNKKIEYFLQNTENFMENIDIFNRFLEYPVKLSPKEKYLSCLFVSDFSFNNLHNGNSVIENLYMIMKKNKQAFNLLLFLRYQLLNFTEENLKSLFHNFDILIFYFFELILKSTVPDVILAKTLSLIKKEFSLKFLRELNTQDFDFYSIKFDKKSFNDILNSNSLSSLKYNILKNIPKLSELLKNMEEPVLKMASHMNGFKATSYFLNKHGDFEENLFFQKNITEELVVEIRGDKDIYGYLGSNVSGVCISTNSIYRDSHIGNGYLNLIVRDNSKIYLWGLLILSKEIIKQDNCIDIVKSYLLNNLQGSIPKKYYKYKADITLKIQESIHSLNTPTYSFDRAFNSFNLQFKNNLEKKRFFFIKKNVCHDFFCDNSLFSHFNLENNDYSDKYDIIEGSFKEF